MVRNLAAAKEKLKAAKVDMLNTPAVIDLQASRTCSNFRVGVSPCLTATRASQGGCYISTAQRMTRWWRWVACRDPHVDYHERLVKRKQGLWHEAPREEDRGRPQQCNERECALPTLAPGAGGHHLLQRGGGAA
jgi:hypothetical protein